MELTQVQLAASANQNVLVREHISKKRDNPEATRWGQKSGLFHRGAGNRREEIKGNRVHIKALELDGQLQNLFISLAEPEDSAGADRETRCLCLLNGPDALVKRMGLADLVEEALGALLLQIQKWRANLLSRRLNMGLNVQ
jgi:hypothetical protein